MFELRPFRKGENNVFHYLDDLERSFFGELSADVAHFRTDVIDRGNCYELQADLPGFKKEDIKIDLNDNTMTVSAKHHEESEEKTESYVRRERRCGSYSRSFDLNGIAKDSIRAQYADGVLKLTLPKEEKKAPASRQIAIQ